MCETLSGCSQKNGKNIGLSEQDDSQPHGHSASIETELLLWWEDYYLPVFEYVLPIMGDLQGKRVLELGTGTGGTATLLAKKGASVVGIDLLPFRLDAAQERVKHHNVTAMVDFSLMDATQLAFPDDTFDFVISKSVLVFTEHAQTAKECNRVLKRGGKAIFIENMRHHPAVWLYRKFFLKYSRELRYFSLSDIEALNTEFDEVNHKEFHFLSLGALFWKKVISIPIFYRWSLQFLRFVDRNLIRLFPFLKRICWITAIICHKKT